MDKRLLVVEMRNASYPERQQGRGIINSGSVVELREQSEAYKAGFGTKNDVLSEKNSYFLKENNIIP